MTGIKHGSLVQNMEWPCYTLDLRSQHALVCLDRAWIVLLLLEVVQGFIVGGLHCKMVGLDRAWVVLPLLVVD